MWASGFTPEKDIYIYIFTCLSLYIYIYILPYPNLTLPTPSFPRSYPLLTPPNPTLPHSPLPYPAQFGTAVHEIGHVMGLWHEQQRSDRDAHVKVIWRNVGYLAGQFFKTKTNNQDLPYNFGSIMHYGPKVMSVTATAASSNA